MLLGSRPNYTRFSQLPNIVNHIQSKRRRGEDKVRWRGERGESDEEKRTRSGRPGEVNEGGGQREGNEEKLMIRC